MQAFRLEVGVALEVVPAFVPGHKRYLLNIVPFFEQLARTLVPKVVEVQVGNLELTASLGEVFAQGLRMDREDAIATLRPGLDDLPGRRQQRNPLVVADLLTRVFSVLLS